MCCHVYILCKKNIVHSCFIYLMVCDGVFFFIVIYNNVYSSTLKYHTSITFLYHKGFSLPNIGIGVSPQKAVMVEL